MKKIIKKILPPALMRVLHRNGFVKQYIPPRGKIAWGDLKRTSPISTEFGYDRGGPVDRYYIEGFLGENTHHIKGRALEIGDNYYTRQFGKEQVVQSEILHVDKNNPAATIIGDLSNLSHVADNSFDCIILTQTLHLIYDHKAALETCSRILAKDGVLLITVPGITNIDHGEWAKTWYWSFTEASIKRMLADVFGEHNIQINCYGNVLSATAFLYGTGMNEISNEEKDIYDPHYPVIIAAIAEKRSL